MTPDDVVAVMPDDETIVRAVFAAAARTGDSAVDVLNGAAGVHARYYAGIALAQEYPTAPRRTLSRKLGCERALSAARAEMTKRAAAWFDLGKLNGVRAACGWADMTLDEARAAPLTFCGRRWDEFLDRGDAFFIATSVDTGPAFDKAPVFIQSSNPDADPPKLPADLLPKKGADAGPSVEIAPAILQSSDGRAEGRALEGPTQLLKDSQDTGSRSDGQARSEGCRTPGLIRQVREPATAVLKGREAARTENLSGEGGEPVVEPGPSDASPSRRGAGNGGLGAKSGDLEKEIRAPAAAPKDERRAPDELSTLRAAELGRGSVSYRRADAPPEKRGVTVVTAALMGDPTPELRAKMAATPGRSFVERGR